MANTERQQPTSSNRKTGLEQDVMGYLWEHGSVSAEQVRIGLERKRPLADSTVRTVLRRLVEKRLVQRKLHEGVFQYQAAKQPGRVAAETVRGLIQNLCNGSLKELLIGMVEYRVADSSELRKLAQEIEARKNEQTSRGDKS